MNPEKVNSIYVQDGVDKGRVENPDLAQHIAGIMDKRGMDEGLNYEKFAEEEAIAGRSILPEMSPEQIENCRIFYGLLEKNPELSELVMKDYQGGSYISLVDFRDGKPEYRDGSGWHVDGKVSCLYLHEIHGPIYVSFDSGVMEYTIENGKGRLDNSRIERQKFDLQGELVKLRLSFNPDDLETRPLNGEWLKYLNPGEVFDNDFIVIGGVRRKLSNNIGGVGTTEKKGGIWKKGKNPENEKPLLNIGSVSLVLLDYDKNTTAFIDHAIKETLPYFRARNEAIKRMLG